MSDPFPSPPGTNPPRHIEQDKPASALWPAAILGGCLLLGVLFFSFATREDRTADNSAPTTTGQSTRQPARPANPSAAIPAQPAPAPASR